MNEDAEYTLLEEQIPEVPPFHLLKIPLMRVEIIKDCESCGQTTQFVVYSDTERTHGSPPHHACSLACIVRLLQFWGDVDFSVEVDTR